MKNHYLTILSLASLAVLAGCASNGNNQNAQNATEQQPAQPVDDGIDWEKPLYAIQSNGDTTYRYEYDAEGRISKELLRYDYGDIITNYVYDGKGNLVSQNELHLSDGSEVEVEKTNKYDSQNRLIESFCGAYEEQDEMVTTFKYEGNKRIETGTEGECPYIIESYFDANNNDTLIVKSVENGDYDDGDGSIGVDVTETRISYVFVGGKYLEKSNEIKSKPNNGDWKVTESTSNEYNTAGKLTKQTYEGSNMSYISTYEYDNAGHLVKYVSKNTNKEDNSSETSEITYKYTDNCCESSTGVKTYYKRK
ncbi:MAG: hypothetical protein PUC50_06200 [Bacteroidales bacterium]|nr:hypothetical protein [Bacteroidales bacterium]